MNVNSIKRIEIFEKDGTDEEIREYLEFMKESFNEIINLYSEKDRGFIENIDFSKNKVNIFYVIKNTKGNIEACLWVTKEHNTYVSKYIGVGTKNQGLGKRLKIELENDVILESNKIKKSLSIVSTVKKDNILSQKFNESLGYIKFNMGEGYDFDQYYKDIEPDII